MLCGSHKFGPPTLAVDKNKIRVGQNHFLFQHSSYNVNLTMQVSVTNKLSRKTCTTSTQR